jgi:predicted GIY-YIG superfamily endonuclease
MEHNAGKVSYSRRFRPWNLVFCQKFADIKTANVVESKLKRWKRRDYIEKVIEDGYIRAIPTPT